MNMNYKLQLGMKNFKKQVQIFNLINQIFYLAIIKWFNVQIAKHNLNLLVVSQIYKGQIDLNYKDDNKKVLSHDACVSFFENRFNCIQCKTEQCKGCRATPFHKGFTCQQYEQNKKQKKCQFCLQVVCIDKSCENRLQNLCDQQLNCGHNCFGFKNEKKCPDCIVCKKVEHDYCNICMTEGLNQAPIIQSKCGHYFHYHCIKTRLDLQWFYPRITFGFLQCPLCKQWLEFVDSPLQQLIEKNIHLLNVIQQKSLQRLNYEQRENDEKLIQPHSQFYKNPRLYSLALYSYYMCFKCQEPYYGGLRDCERAIEENQQADYKKQDLICPKCCPLAIDSCKIKDHGKDYIQWKCKFCCSIAVWFCWGHTHFCDSCHRRQCAGEHLNKKKHAELQQCPGVDKCPLKIAHLPNGNEQCLGCQLCLNHKQNQNDF